MVADAESGTINFPVFLTLVRNLALAWYGSASSPEAKAWVSETGAWLEERLGPDPNYPQMPNKPFRIDLPPVNKTTSEVLLSPIHAYYHNIEQINGNRNDMFAAMSTVGGYTMGYFDGSQMKMWKWAKDYTLADNFFMGAYGGSYLNQNSL